MSQTVADNIIRIPASVDTNFFRYWVEFLRPIHHLTEREMDVLAIVLRERHELSKVILDEDIIGERLFSSQTKARMREALDMSQQHLQIILGKFKQIGLIEDDKVNGKLIPKLNEDSSGFKLMLYFDLK